MRRVPVSDDPAEVWLSPERCAAARALLRWTIAHLAARVCKDRADAARVAREVRQYEDYGVPLAAVLSDKILAALLDKVEFTTTEGEPGVCRKAGATRAQRKGCLVFGGSLKRRSPL